MEDIEVEYLDEYKDLVLPGIKTSPEGRANQALDRMPQKRRISSDSSDSSSIDPDIFQKLFDGKFLDDELLTEKGSNSKRSNRCRLSSSSSDSNDALDALYNRKRTHYNRRNRLESYDSIDDLGDALMGLKSKAVPTPAAKNVLTDGSRRGIRNTQPTKKYITSPVFKPKSTAESTRPGTRPNGRSSSSSSSNISILHNKKKAVTIIKATKPDLKPPKHEPKKDPLNLQEFSDDTETDSSFERESDFYEDTDEDTPEMSKSIIDLSTDSSLVTSLADTVTPVVSEDESLNEQRNRCTSVARERLQIYLNSLSSAESPPSSYKYTNREKKSLSREKQSISSDQKDDNPSENFVDHSLANADINLGTPGSSETQQSDVEKSRADYVDANLTYESVERLSRSLAKEITKIDEERTKEFEKRSASKTRVSTSSKKTETVVETSPITKTHVRKLTYSSEHLNETTPLVISADQQGNTDTVIPKRGRGRPSKKSIAAATLQIVSKRPVQPIIKKEQEPTVDNVNTEELHPVKKIKRKPGRPRKNRKNETHVSAVVSEKTSDHSDPNPSQFKSESVNTDEQNDLNNLKNKTHPINTFEISNTNGSVKVSQKTEVRAGRATTETEAIIMDTEDHSTQTQAVAMENLGMELKHAEQKDNSQLIKQYSAKDKTENVANSEAKGEAINNSECAKLGRVNPPIEDNTKTGSDEHAPSGVDSGVDETPQTGLSIQTPETKMNKSLKITKNKADTNQECFDKNVNDGNESSSSVGMPVRKRLLRSESVSTGTTTTQLRNSPRLAGKLSVARSWPRPTKGTRSQKRNTSSKVQTSDTDSKTGSDSPSLEQAAPVTKSQLSIKDIKSRTVDKDNLDKSIQEEGKEKSLPESTPSATKDDRIELSKSSLSFNKGTVLKTDIEMDSNGDQGGAQTEEKMTGIVRGMKALHSERGQEKSHSTMAPPATPKRDLSTGKAVSVLRSLGKSSKMDEEPKPKRSKLSGPAQDQEAKPREIMESVSVEEQKINTKKQTLLANTIADAENVANKTPKKPLSHERQKTTLRVTKKTEDNKAPSLKSNLLTLLSGDESTVIDNSVIITKTPIMSRSEPFKKVETPATPTCGINISVSYYSPSKKLVNQAETVEKMKLSLCTKNLDDPPDALKTPSIQKVKRSLPVESGQKVDAIGKRISQPDKAPRQRVAGRATPMGEVMQTVSKDKESESLKAKESVSERMEQGGSENIEAVNTITKLPGTKSKEALEAQSEAQKDAISAATVSSPSASGDSCNERKKRIVRTPKLTHPVPCTVTSVNNLVRSLARAPTPVANPNLQDQPTKSINDGEADVPAPGPSQEPQATPQSPAECPKEQPVASDPSIAFPVRIIAATNETVTENVKSLAEPIATSQSQAPPVIVPSRPTKTNELKLKAHPLLGKERKLCVRLKRCEVKNWFEGLNRTAMQPVSRIIQADGIPTPTHTKADANNTQADAPVISVPLPVPLPPLEFKTEQIESLQQQSMGLDVPVAQGQTAVNTSTTNRNNVTNSTTTTITPSSTSTTCSITSTPSASIANDQNTFGATKMFSFLYPSRYRNSYGNVGLDCCCPNLDGPMQAIDPTRLHSKAEVPVLELPECVVITTKVISKHDKNIPPKVKAKLEQLTAKDNLPCAIQAISMSSKNSATVATPIGHTSTSVSTPASDSDNTVNSTAQQSVPHSAADTSVSTTARIGNHQEDVKARVQCFDDLFQSLARQAASISLTERKRVVNNIVKTTSLQPAEVEIGMKLLKDYAYHVNAVMQSQLQLHPRVFPLLTSIPTTATKTRTGMNSVLPMGTDSTVSPNLRQNLNTRPIFDKGNIIGYQYLAKHDQGTSGIGSAVPVISQHSLISKDTNAISSNSTGTCYLNPSPEEDERVRMGAQNLLNASPVQTTCRSMPLTSVNKVLSAVNSMPLLETNPPAFCAAGKEDGSNDNLFIVNQVMSPPEECILPDAIGTLDVATEIKGEVDDAELLT